MTKSDTEPTAARAALAASAQTAGAGAEVTWAAPNYGGSSPSAERSRLFDTALGLSRSQEAWETAVWEHMAALEHALAAAREDEKAAHGKVAEMARLALSHRIERDAATARAAHLEQHIEFALGYLEEALIEDAQNTLLYALAAPLEPAHREGEA